MRTPNSLPNGHPVGREKEKEWSMVGRAHTNPGPMLALSLRGPSTVELD